MKPLCDAPTCFHTAYAKGFCHRHYMQMRKHGHVTIEQAPIRYHGQLCTQSGCNHPAKVKSLCHKHYDQMRRSRLMSITDTQWDLVLRYLALFLDGMPGVTIDRQCVDNPAYEVIENVGGPHKYILWSFGNFLEQMVPDRGEALDVNELERARTLLPTW